MSRLKNVEKNASGYHLGKEVVLRKSSAALMEPSARLTHWIRSQRELETTTLEKEHLGNTHLFLR